MMVSNSKVDQTKLNMSGFWTYPGEDDWVTTWTKKLPSRWSHAERGWDGHPLRRESILQNAHMSRMRTVCWKNVFLVLIWRQKTHDDSCSNFFNIRNILNYLGINHKSTISQTSSPSRVVATAQPKDRRKSPRCWANETEWWFNVDICG